MTYLLDVNVLVALIDPNHVAHDAAHHWFETIGARAWATCPITENGVIRIVGNVKYPSTPGSPAEVARIVAQMRELPGHVFWADDISLLGDERIDPSQLLTSAQVTDTYLLALAVAHEGKLATFDRRLSPKAVTASKAALHLIGHQ
ncbi:MULTISPECIES: TA system VapC family ribonuclease toxin [Sphingobium]|uniref:TA system VapC family ribonuclease toxin n=1 Tax=Sphingobium TaxID=165695 RepID=UPI000C3C11EB|nr:MULTISPECIES: TA system VapC family ribonuclease toxin [Sphingobium]MBS51075.1 VapC toxin family PIN domain ribonuclease [Sphingobium sp.]MCC4256176.1 PIN domain-containing protein [Sphingobium lactosutens]HCW62122.1 VapC toxin family PIN domain ribonuclease [Sphingobium sp.]